MYGGRRGKYGENIMNLDDITYKLNAYYDVWKDGESLKDEYRKIFFDTAKEEIKKKMRQKSLRILNLTLKKNHFT